jgi:hypothetical protein
MSKQGNTGTSTNREQLVEVALDKLLKTGETLSFRGLAVTYPETIDFLIKYQSMVLDAENPPYFVTDFFIDVLNYEKQRLMKRINEMDEFKLKFEPINDKAMKEWQIIEEQKRFDANPVNGGGSYRRGTSKRSNKKSRKTKYKRH